MNKQQVSSAPSLSGVSNTKIGISFDLAVDGVPYSVKAQSFSFNDELRYRVMVNSSDEYIFVPDPDLGHLRAIDDDNTELPDNVEEAISERLLTAQKKLK